MYVRICRASLATSRLPGSVRAAMAPIRPSMAFFSSTAAPSASTCSSSSSLPSATPGKVHVRIRTSDGVTYERMYNEGDNLMEAIRDDSTLPVDVPGACNGTSKCSTCHVILQSAEWARTAERLFAVSDSEQDCLDRAPGASDASRLSCQLTLVKGLNGLEIDLPKSVVDVRWQTSPRRSAKK
ncbi:hypothetical protein JKF63_03964 [Porcisia hertigi]|uniref:2Fe-2S ferredoxin-type domain-containing protein n=1 Tax=Porcisia hertigi TaxID=2761500 RepID=A0A836IM21_9TRYP|nr:hypothetical protein JKF63_03964 [Porcisia hertigi]